MAPRSIGLNDQLQAYVLSWGIREPTELKAVREETARLAGGHMMLAPEEAQLVGMLAKLVGAKRYLEIGTFTGYSTLAMAMALPQDGQIVACELEQRFIDIARTHWIHAGVADKIEVRLGPALDAIEKLSAEGTTPFDIAFIDADKENTLAYYEKCMPLVRPNGLILIDNTLWHGAVADPDDTSAATQAIRDVNRRVHEDPRVEMVLVPVGDGLTIARKVG